MRMPKLSARLRILLITYSMTIGLCACGSGSDNLPVDAPVADTYGEPSQSSAVPSSADTNISSADASSPETEAVTDAEPLRDATPVCLVPRADGTATASNDVAVIDYSHMSDGYVCANYTGTCPKVKLRITGPDTVVYTYDLHGGGYETFPLSSGDGYYDVTIYENISGTNYATCLYADLDVQITDAFSPFLYPNQYVNFTADSKVVAKGQELAEGASSDLEVITRIIHILEDQLDCRLFLREPRGLKLTEEGKRLYAHVAIACQHLLDAEAELCRDKNVCSGTIELGVTETALHLFLLQNLHDFQTGYPEIKIRIQNNTTPEILKSLQNGRLDLAVVTTPFELHDALACEDLLTFREVPAGGPDYAALSDRPMTLKEFRLHSIIGLGYGTASYEYYRKVFIEQHLDYEPAMEVATADLVIPLLQNNLGVGFVPEPLAAPFFENDSLVPLTLNVPLPSREVKMLWDKSRSQSRATATFCSYLRERCQRNLPILDPENESVAGN
jgi:DNA-binding transcriptional LysR family regulator